MGIEVTEEAAGQMRAYLAAITEANARFNLTRVPPEDMVHTHICDALAPLKLGLVPQGARLLDVGAGAGVPGIPLKLARPDIRLTLLDSTLKKVNFMRDTLAALGIGASAIHARAEQLMAEAAHKGAYDVVVARAVAPLKRLIAWTLPFVRAGGAALLYKGPGVNEELADVVSSEMHRYNAALYKTIRYDVPLREWERNIVVYKKR